MKKWISLLLLSTSLVNASTIFQKALNDITKLEHAKEEEKACNYNDYDEYVASVHLRVLGKENLERMIASGFKVPSQLQMHKLYENNSKENYAKLNVIPPYDKAQKLLAEKQKNILSFDYFLKRYKGNSEKASTAYRAYKNVIDHRLVAVSKASYSDNFESIPYASYVDDAEDYRSSYAYRANYTRYVVGLANTIADFSYITDYNFDEKMLSSDYMYYAGHNFMNWTERTKALEFEEFEKLPCQNSNAASINQSRDNTKADIGHKKVKGKGSSQATKQ